MRIATARTTLVGLFNTEAHSQGVMEKEPSGGRSGQLSLVVIQPRRRQSVHPP